MREKFNLNNEKGSITVFVLVALLFMSAFLIISYASNANKSKIVKEQLEIIESIYKMKIETTDNIYNKASAVPIINDLPEIIYVGATSIQDYIDSGDGEEIKLLEIKIDEKIFNSELDMNKYIEDNNLYSEKEITITVTNSLDNTATKTQTVTFKAIEGPVIKNLPSTIITNVTQISDSYVSYDKLGKKEEVYTIVEINTDFTSVTQLVTYADEWLTENNQYEVDVNIKIKATGNDNLTSESTQAIKFIRGISVTNETELNTALATVSPLYINVANDIECSNTISVDGITHTLDLNNKTISKTVVNESFTFITLGSNTNLTIIDSSKNQNGTILAKLHEEVESDGDDRKTNIICIQNQGTLNINSGKVSADSIQLMLEKKKGTEVDNTCTAINNTGTINLNGGTINCNIGAKACCRSSVKTATAYAYGIINSGTINANSGYIITNADAYVIKSAGIWGKTHAYSYGIQNSGTINNKENITFTTTVRAHQTDTYSTDEDSADIKED